MRISDWSSDVCSSDLSPKQAKPCWCPPPQAPSALQWGRSPRYMAAAPLELREGPQKRSAAFRNSAMMQPSIIKARMSPIVLQSSARDRKRVVEGKGESVRVDCGGRRYIKKKKK